VELVGGIEEVETEVVGDVVVNRVVLEGLGVEDDVVVDTAVLELVELLQLPPAMYWRASQSYLYCRM
jgi:hypothetical protein